MKGTGDWRELVGTVSLRTSVASFILGFIDVLAIFELPAASVDGPLGTLFGQALAWIVLLTGLMIPIACFGRDSKRAFALTVSIVTFVVFGTILGAGE